jgi:predicted nucleotidyltransferase
MKTDIQLKAPLLQKIKMVVERFPFNEKKISVFLFGSRIVSKATSVSDIDVGLLGDRNVPASLIQDFRDALEELPVFYKFDVVDFSKTSSGFRRHAMKTIFPLN